MRNMIFRVFLVICVVAPLASCYKILLLTPFNGKSHWILMETIIEALLARHHEVTSITNFKWNGPKPANYTEILIDPPLDFDSYKSQEEMIKTADKSPFATVFEYGEFCSLSADYALSSDNVRAFIKRDDLKFDLVINEEFFHDSFLMFAHKYNAPIVTISTYGTSDFFDAQMGLFTPLSHVPHSMLAFSDDMTLYERLYNLALSTIDTLLRRFSRLPQQNELAKKHFAHLEPLPSLEDLLQRISVIMVYTHLSISYPRPRMPGLINIGGAHIKPNKPLPSDIQLFLDEASDGAIFFSLGTFVRSSRLPKEQLEAFLYCFRRIKQRVIWKFENETPPDLPPNVMIRSWLPQNDILSHKNVILFISHGGVFGSVESIWHGVPSLITAFFGDQYRNAMRATRSGYAKYIPFFDITNQTLMDSIQEMIQNKSYLHRAKKVSSIFRANLVPPMQEAVFWIEYVCQFIDVPHLKSHAANMSWFVYLSLDILCLLLVLIVCLLLLLRLIFRCCCRRNVVKKKSE